MISCYRTYFFFPRLKMNFFFSFLLSVFSHKHTTELTDHSSHPFKSDLNNRKIYNFFLYFYAGKERKKGQSLQKKKKSHSMFIIYKLWTAGNCKISYHKHVVYDEFLFSCKIIFFFLRKEVF